MASIARLILAALLAMAALLVPAAGASAAGSVVISEVQARGAVPARSPNPGVEEWVELVNTGAAPIDIGGWAVHIYSGGSCVGSPDGIAVIPSPTVLPRGRRFLIAPMERTQAPAADLHYSLGSDAIGSTGTVELLDEEVVDRVAWGDPGGGCAEGHFEVSFLDSDDKSIERIGGQQDTDDNDADFEPRTPGQPQNKDSIPDDDDDGTGDDVDNCYGIANSDQANADGDAAGDACDSDDDNDGISDDADACPKVAGQGPNGCPPDPTPTPTATAPPALVPGPIIVPYPGPTVGLITLEPPSPTAGRPVTLVIDGLDPDDAVNGAYVEVGSSQFSGFSACQMAPPGGFPAGSPFAPGTRVRTEIPLSFARAGLQMLRVHIRSGECGGTPDVTTAVVLVVVGAAKSSGVRASAARAGATPAATRRAKSCRDPHLALTARNRARFAAAVFCLQNLERRKRGLRVLKRSAVLGRMAVSHAGDMVADRFFSHVSPTRGDLDTRARRFRYRGRIGENVGGGRATPRKLISAYLNSAAHRANLLGRSWRYASVAVVPSKPVGRRKPGGTFASMFGTTRR